MPLKPNLTEGYNWQPVTSRQTEPNSSVYIKQASKQFIVALNVGETEL